MRGRKTHWFYSYVEPIFVMVFWLGVIHGVLGSVITFVPGGEAHYFAFTSVLIAAGLITRGYKYRIAAALLLVLFLAATYNGYVRGIEYQELLKTLPN